MKNEFLVSMLLFLSVCGVGCAHLSEGHSRGAVVFIDSVNEGHVCIGGDEVKVGETVDVFRASCKKIDRPTKDNPDRKFTVCENSFVGTAEILALSDEHFVKVKSLGGITLEQGMIIEKKKVK